MSASFMRATLGVAASIALLAPVPLRAAPTTISGCVMRPDGVAIANASVSVSSTVASRTLTDRRGCFTIAAATDAAVVRVDATGYEPFVRRDVRAGSELAVTLASATTSLVTIGGVAVDGRRGVSTASAPSVTIDAQRGARLGARSVAELLDGELALTSVRPAGGGSNAPRVFSLRGPDQTETLVDIDGHQINNSNTGDFDLATLSPEDFQDVELVYGIAPSSLVGPNTIGGAINLRTLEPTATPHGLTRLSAGSFGDFGTTVQSTGTLGRIGYALSLNRRTSQNEIRDRPISRAGDDPGEIHTDVVASGSQTNSALLKARYAFGRAPTAGYAEVSVRNQSTLRDQSAGLSSALESGLFQSFAGSFVAAHSTGYGLDVRLPLGRHDASGIPPATLTLRHFSSTADQSVFGPVADTSSSYFFNDRDAIRDDSIEYDRTGATTSFSVKAMLRTEDLSEPFGALSRTGQSDRSYARLAGAARIADAAVGDAEATATAATRRSQTQRSIVGRYTFDAASRLHATVATYLSDFSTFGSSIDPRVGLVWTPSSRTSVRASVGTTFQPPSLTALFVPDPLPDARTSLVHIGNANLTADRATEYDLGGDHLFSLAGSQARASLDLYRTNLRTPAQTYVPASGTGYTYPINIGGAVYQGVQATLSRDIAPGTRLALGYSIDNAYPTTVPDAVATGSLVAGRQFLGTPLQRGFFRLSRDPQLGYSFDLHGSFEGRNNELNRPPFLLLDAAVGYRLAAYRVDLSVKNLTNVYADGFTKRGAGVPYAGADGPIPLDAYTLAPTRIGVSLSRLF
ncbi:MAG: hypothetical protein NVSMB21_23880 [Vulcanimicrobiaceae bacterium]